MSSRGNNRKNKSFPKVVTKRGREKKRMEQSESELDDPNDESYEASEHEFGQGSSAVHGGGQDDEMGNASDEDHEINVTLFCGQKKAWTATSYIQARRVTTYTLENDSPSPHFHTKVQHDAFFGHLLNKNVYEHRWIDWEFIAKYATINCLIDKFRHIRLFEFVKHKCDWNDNIIRQFYATCEIDWENEKIEWMTGTRRYNATIQEFAIANKLDYAHIWGSHDVWNKNKLMETIWYAYYEAASHGHQVKYGTVTSLKLVPTVVNKIVRHTIFSKSGNPDAVHDHHWNCIHHILEGRTIDVLRFVLKNIEDISCSIQQSLYYAPYIMSLILVKTHFSAQNCDVKHKGYGPFRASPQLLNPHEQQGNPDAQGNNDANGPPNDADDTPQQPPPPHFPHPSWQQLGPPPADFFNHLMPHIQQASQQGMQAGMASFSTNYNEQFHEPTMTRMGTIEQSVNLARTDISALNDQFQNLSTDVTDLRTEFQGFQQQFTDFMGHFYHLYPCPPPPPGYMPYPYYPPPPPPASED